MSTFNEKTQIFIELYPLDIYNNCYLKQEQNLLVKKMNLYKLEKI